MIRSRIGSSALLVATLVVVSSARPVSAQMSAYDAAARVSPASDLRSGLNALLQEHVYLASAATGAALGGRNAEFTAAAGALDSNSVALSQAIGSVYGADAGTAFLALWRKHIGFFVDYTVATANKDRAKQDAAVNGLVQYTQDFGAFIASANPNLTKGAVASLVKSHVLGLKTVVDAQAMRDPTKAFLAERSAAAHMSMIATPLADAIVKQFPERFAVR